jgi:hypothetical protein
VSEDRPGTVRRELTREVWAAGLVVSGTVGLLTVLWLVDPLVFAGAVCVLLILVGVLLGFEGG